MCVCMYTNICRKINYVLIFMCMYTLLVYVYMYNIQVKGLVITPHIQSNLIYHLI